MQLRYKCENCKNVFNVTEGQNPICTCGKEQVDNQGAIMLYRQGSFVGVAVGYGIYINGEPYGHLANKESIKIPLPYGQYTIHCTCGLTRRCQDLTVTLSQENPLAYAKARIKMGVWSNTIFVEECPKEEFLK